MKYRKALTTDSQMFCTIDLKCNDPLIKFYLHFQFKIRIQPVQDVHFIFCFNIWPKKFEKLKIKQSSSSKATFSGWLVTSLVVFYGLSTFKGNLMRSPPYTYILDMYDLVWLGVMSYQQQ